MPRIESQTALDVSSPADDADGPAELDKDLDWARRLTATERQSKAALAEQLKIVEAAYADHNVVGFYEALADLYDIARLRYSADSARRAAQQAAARLGRSAPDTASNQGEPTTRSRSTASPASTPSVTSIAAATATPSAAPTPAVATPPPTSTPPASTATPSSDTLSNDLDWATRVLSRQRGDKSELTSHLAVARQAHQRGEIGATYSALAQFYEAAGMSYAASSARRAAAAAGDSSVATTAAKPTEKPTPGPSASTAGRSAPTRRSSPTTADDSSAEEREIEVARRALARGSAGDRQAQEQRLINATAALHRGDRRRMYLHLAEFYDTAGLRFSADSAREAASMLRSPASDRKETEIAAAALPTPTPATVVPPQVETKQVPKAMTPQSPPQAAMTPPTATPSPRPPNSDDERELERARTVVANNKRGGAERSKVLRERLSSATEALANGDRATMFAELAQLYSEARMRYSAQQAADMANQLNAEPPPKTASKASEATTRPIGSDSTEAPKPVTVASTRPTTNRAPSTSPPAHDRTTDEDQLALERARGHLPRANNLRNADQDLRRAEAAYRNGDRAGFYRALTTYYRNEGLADAAARSQAIADALLAVAKPTPPPPVVTQKVTPATKRSEPTLTGPMAQLLKTWQRTSRAFETWQRAWQNEDLKTYIGAYADDFRSDGRDLAALRKHRAEVFERADQIEVDVAESALSGGLDRGTRSDRYQVVLHVEVPGGPTSRSREADCDENGGPAVTSFEGVARAPQDVSAETS